MKLYTQFISTDSDRDGKLMYDDVIRHTNANGQESVMRARIISVFLGITNHGTERMSLRLSFDQFLDRMAVFLPITEANKISKTEEKMRFMFAMYQPDHGHLTKATTQSLYSDMRPLLTQPDDSGQHEKYHQKLHAEIDRNLNFDKHGQLSFEGFCKECSDIPEQLTINFA